MIIVPNIQTKQNLLEKLATDSIMSIDEYAEALLDQSHFHKASKAQLLYCISQKVDRHHINPTLSHIQAIYRSSLNSAMLSSSKHPNSKWLAGILDHIESTLEKYKLIHPDNILNRLTKLSVTHLYDELYHHGFDLITPSQKTFFDHFNIQELKLSEPPSKHHHQYFQSIEDEVKTALSWQSESPDRQIILLDNQSYTQIINRELYAVTGTDHSSISPMLELIIGVSSPTPVIPSHLIPFLIKHHKRPKGLDLGSLLSKRLFKRSIDINLSHYFNTLDHPITQDKSPISSAIALDYIYQTALLWGISANDPIHEILINALGQIKSISSLDDHLPYQTWHNLFSQILKPKRARSPIISALDAMGGWFKEAWILGAQSENWQCTQIFPAIPKEYLITERYDFLANIADHTIFSLQKSGISGEHLILPEFLQSRAITITRSTQSVTLEELIDEPFELNDKIEGGIGLIQDYAACPFKAFARYRMKLFSKSLQTHGILPNHYGTVTHNALEKLYESISSKDDLESINLKDIPDMIEQSWQRLPALSHLQPNLTTIIKNRLHETITKWLETDRNRDDFTISSLEKAFTLTFGEHQINIRVDRIDSENGRPVLIDYKTGQTNITDTFHPNFHHPQMALYALTQPMIPTVAYAKLHHEKTTYQALNLDCEKTVKKHTQAKGETITEINELMDQWKKRSENILNRYKLGIYTITPVNPSVCNLCDFQSLCRVYDLGEY